MSEATLLIFMRNLVPGKVKTRIAATMGDDMALKIYHLLVKHTALVTKDIAATKFVYYSDHIENDDVWDDSYLKVSQRGSSLGERMANAFKDTFRFGPHKVVIIGTDCCDLTSAILTNAFIQLSKYDVVIGPALDGGYYLLGMKVDHPRLFENVAWSTNSVLAETIMRCNNSGLNYFLLPELNDIDNEQDLAGTGILEKL